MTLGVFQMKPCVCGDAFAVVIMPCLRRFFSTVFTRPYKREVLRTVRIAVFFLLPLLFSYYTFKDSSLPCMENLKLFYNLLTVGGRKKRNCFRYKYPFVFAVQARGSVTFNRRRKPPQLNKPHH